MLAWDDIYSFWIHFFDDPIALVSPVLGIGWVDGCENEFSTSMLRYKNKDFDIENIFLVFFSSNPHFWGNPKELCVYKGIPL